MAMRQERVWLVVESDTHPPRKSVEERDDLSALKFRNYAAGMSVRFRF